MEFHSESIVKGEEKNYHIILSYLIQHQYLALLLKGLVKMARINRIFKPCQGQHFPTLNSAMENIFRLIDSSKKNKSHVQKFTAILKPIVKALSGVDYHFIRKTEFYSDLKETLNKIHSHIVEAKKRGKLTKIMMAKKDQEFLTSMQQHIDLLCGRIFLANAQRLEKRKTSFDLL